MIYETQVCLSSHTSLGIASIAKYFVVVESQEELRESILWAKENEYEFFILGEGSNVVFGPVFDGLVIKVSLKKIHFGPNINGFVNIDVEAGFNFDELIAQSVDRNLWGLENLSWIPGTVGAAPIQNVGAFGQSVSRVIESVRCLDIDNDVFIDMSNSECEFSHRKSVFNRLRSSKYIVALVRFKLSVNATPILERHQLKFLRNRKGDTTKLHRDIRDFIINYRSSGKTLPAGVNEGSTGTFFQSPLIKSNKELYFILFRCYRHLGVKAAAVTLAYVIRHKSKAGFKLSSNNIIRQCGLSSVQFGAVKCLKSNPSVLVVDTSMSPNVDDFVSLVSLVMSTVYLKTGVILPIEPTIVSETMKRSFFDQREII